MDRKREDKRYKILIVENNAVFRKGLEHLLNHESDIAVHGYADSEKKALVLAGKTRPDLVITDIYIQGDSGVRLIKAIKKAHPDVPVLVLSMHEESLYAKLAVKAGASGYLTMQEAPETIIMAIRRILGGGTYTSENLTDR
jgi:DNA-binding NarL/FixJ family response regulator